MKKNSTHCRPAFTLVELLVAIAIIGMLIGLLLPAVQAARSTAQRMQCTNHMKQLGLALHNYHDTKNAFPAGTYRYGGSSTRKGQKIAILPFIEQGVLYDQYLDVPVTDNNPYSTTQPLTPTIFTIWIEIYLCPSDAGRSAPRYGVYGRPTNYRESYGDWPSYGDSTWGRHKTPNPRGFYSTHHSSTFDPQRSETRTVSSIRDGTSNTIAMSEALIGIAANSTTKNRSIFGTLVDSVSAMGNPVTNPGSAAVTSPTAVADIKACWDTMGPNKRYRDSIADSRLWSDRAGRSWGDSQTWRSGFMTIFPPNNGPNCLAGTISGFDQSLNISTASSYHRGGVNCLLIDGAVRFISDMIDSRSSNIPADYSVPSEMTTLVVDDGPSSFGVWGALGSIAGGESVSVP